MPARTGRVARRNAQSARRGCGGHSTRPVSGLAIVAVRGTVSAGRLPGTRGPSGWWPASNRLPLRGQRRTCTGFPFHPPCGGHLEAAPV